VDARLAFLIALVGLCGCDSLDSSFRSEMRRKAIEQGLALGYIGGSLMQVLPLKGGLLTDKNLQNHSGPCESCPGWFSSDGKSIVWEAPWPFRKPMDPSLVVKTIAGVRKAAWFGQLNTVAALSLSPDGSRIALEVQNNFPGAPGTGLQYAVLGTANRVMIEGMPPKNEADASDSLGWSPDSHKIVFTRHHKVIVLNIETGVRNVITDGTEPSWSPDGRWISFTSLERTAKLISPSTGSFLTLFDGRKITGPIAWAPDSFCVSFSNSDQDLFDSMTRSHGRIIVYRVKDGAWYIVKRFGPDGGTSYRFGWFYDDKEFLENNNRAGGGRR